MAGNFDKPFRTYHEQMDFLRKRYGMKIPPGDEHLAEMALIDVSYYDLITCYKECMLDPATGKFFPDVDIRFLTDFYFRDRRFQSLMLRWYTFIENSLKAKLAYRMADRFGVILDEYLHPSHYRSGKRQNLTYERVRNEIEKIYRRHNPPEPTRRYKKQYGNAPPWILLKNISFSNAINLSTFFMPEDHRFVMDLMLGPNTKSTVKEGDRIEFFLRGLNIIREFRNVIAHNTKFVTYRTESNRLRSVATAMQLFPKGMLTWKDVRQYKRGIDDAYCSILLVTAFLDDTTFERAFLYGLREFFAEAKAQSPLFLQRYCKISNLPPDIDKRIDAYFSAK